MFDTLKTWLSGTIACFERARGLEDLKRGIRGRLRNSSPLVSLLDKRVFKFKVRIFKREICYFVNFKTSFTPKNWLLKFGFAYRLAQILEPKLLVHEILKFAKTYLIAKRMRHDSAIACTSNVVGVRGLLRGKGATS